ncbi:hypothetical protein CRE_06486 [Caenorhabditis remanei]|uniref:Uncharacterized protein n=1 Tax=Caenorhabditis remanei TaxID=31234 RepID=E3M0Y5_CAERE|nr:hypothetical protein CRE_06486 [Caenorhabditis remanei]
MQKNRKKTKKAIGNSNNQNNQTKEVKGIVAHVESLNDLISLLPLPPSHQSESEDVVVFGVKCEEQNNEVSIIVSDDDDTNEKSSLIEQISELQLANETLEKEKQVLIEQMEVHKTEELKKNASMEELQQIVSTLRSKNETFERSLNDKNQLIKTKKKEVAELNSKISSQAKEKKQVVSILYP